MGPWLAAAGRWLTSLGWGKFFLLGLLLLALVAVAQSVFHWGDEDSAQRVPVDIKVSADDQGLHITAPPDEPQIHLDDRGLRIQSRTHKNGRRESVIIDEHGVRIEEGGPPQQGAAGQPSASGAAGQLSAPGAAGQPSTPGAPPPAKKPEVTIPPGALTDPDKVADAVDAAKDRIEEIVQSQVDRKLAELLPARGGSAMPDLVELALLLLFTLLIAKIALGSKRRAETRAQAASAVAAEESLKRQLAEAQLTTMQAQVEPHFLFNTLASVDYLIETDPARASKMQKNLIQYLRTALPQMRQTSSTLAQEMSLCRAYLEILKVRMEERLHYAIMLPAGLATAAFPPMMLQSLVENAIKHGLEPKPEGGDMTLGADVVDGNLRVSVSDTGLGFGAAGVGGSGVGLSNIRERLQALFGPAGRLTIEANTPGGTIVTVQIPYRVSTPASAAPASATPASAPPTAQAA